MSTKRSYIEILLPFRLAANERARLFGGLEAFANLGLSEEDFRKFATQWTTFAPVEFRRGERPGEPRGESLGLTPEMHGIVLKYQGWLRRAWLSDPETDRLGLANILLGLGMDLAELYPESSTQIEKNGLRSSLEKLMGEPLLRNSVKSASLPTEGAEPHSHSSTGMETAERKSLKSMICSMTTADSDQYTVYPTVVASWNWGEFNYCPLTDFQRAFYLLFRERWRARVCAQCARYFIADKPPQRYCSPSCNGIAKHKQALKWWRTKGDAKRRVRMRKTGKRKATARRKR